jgi:hypothetical protein
LTEHYFELSDIFATVIWFVIIALSGQMYYLNKKHIPHYKYYMWNLYAKLFGSFFFALVYTQYYTGGDTTAYWQGGVKLHELLLRDPMAYFDEMWRVSSSKLTGISNFHSYAEKPPSWIYNEHQGYFVCKFSSIISILSFKSYYAGTLIMGAITAFCSWRFFEFVLKKNVINNKYIAFSILFIPSTIFWCSGISKDSLILNSIFMLLVSLNLSKAEKSKFFNRIWLLISIFIILKIRAFILIATLAPIYLAINAQLTDKLKGTPLYLGLFRIFSIVGILSFIALYFGTSVLGEFSINSLLEEMKVIHSDFSTNVLYTGRRYDIGVIDYSNIGLLNSFPSAVIASVFRPFIWEVFADGSNPFMLLNGLESLLIFYMIFQFLKTKNIKQRLGTIIKSDLLLFSLFFVLIIGFFVGYTSVLFGVLVRLKAPILPFVALLFSVKTSLTNEIEPISK